ncbi:MAG TPA: energy transducer TonB [Devosia sp.]|nr:energy transducer TonB [Devosia sp.]
MHYALPGSALVHALALGAGLLLFATPQADDAPAMQSVSVEVISIATVSANQTSTVLSDATETLVSAGAEALSPTPPETVEAVQPEPPEPPVELQAIESAKIEPLERVEPERVDVALLSALSSEPLPAETVAPVIPAITPAEKAAPTQPLEQATLQPTQTSAVALAPVPHVLSRPRPIEPTPRATPKPPVQQPAQPRPAAPPGNGGQNQADAVAARPSAGQKGNSGAGGDAEIARYPSQIVAKLRRALRYPRGAGGAAGEVHVQFTVSAGGQPSGVRIVKSSGNAAIDQAGMDTVMRAAPFPPIPASAHRTNWGFTVPLAFVRG